MRVFPTLALPKQVIRVEAIFNFLSAFSSSPLIKIVLYSNFLSSIIADFIRFFYNNI